MITQKTLRGNRTPKSYILSGVRSSDGKRLDQDLNRNLGAEIAKLSREKSELQQGLGGGNTMATYKLKRFSGTQKTYTLKRKSFGVVGNVASGVGSAVNKTVGTVENVAGGVASGTGKAMDSFVGKNVVGAVGGGLAGTLGSAKIGSMIGSVGGPVGTVAGAVGGTLLAPVFGAIGGLAGRGIMSTGGKILKDVGSGLKDDAAARTA